MAELQAIGPLLDALGVEVALGEGEHLVDVLVLARVASFEDGRTALGVYHNDLDWIGQLGLLAAAREAITSGGLEAVE